MPKAQPHFDATGLMREVQQQDVGLVVSTNNPDGFRRILYAACRANPALRCHIYSAPDSKSKFWLLKASAPSAMALTEAAEPEPTAEDPAHD